MRGESGDQLRDDLSAEPRANFAALQMASDYHVNAMIIIRGGGGKSAMSMLRDFFTFVGKVSCFAVKALVGAFQPPLEWEFFLGQLEEIGGVRSRSC